MHRNNKGATLNSLKISEMSLTILSHMHALCRRAHLVKKRSTFLGKIILRFCACALRHCSVMTGYYVTLKYQAKPRTIAWKVFATLKWLDSTSFCFTNNIIGLQALIRFYWDNYMKPILKCILNVDFCSFVFIPNNSFSKEIVLKFSSFSN